MKSASVADARRALRKGGHKWPTRIENIAYQDIPGLGTGELNLASAVTMISGSNGAGKSTLLQAVWSVLQPEVASFSGFSSRRLSGGSVTLTISTQGEIQTLAASFPLKEGADALGHDIEVQHVDTAEDVMTVWSMLDELARADGIVNGVGGYELNDVEVGELSFITRRDYRSITLFEIEEFDAVFPYFEVSYGPNQYNSRSMGSGEHAAFFIWWNLRRAKKASVVLLEEPETYLSQASQDALGAHIVAVAVAKCLCVLTATHSGPIIGPMGPESTQYMFRSPDGIEFNPDAPPALLKQLGIDPPVRAILLVEDSVGDSFCRSILERYDVKLARAVDICSSGGDGNVFNALRNMPDTRRLRIVGVLDGDVRDVTPADVATRCTYLPGTVAVEQAFRLAVAALPNEFRDLVGDDKVLKVLAAIEGMEIHDWYHALATELGLTRTQLFPILFRLWISMEGNEALARQTAEQIAALVDPQT